MANSQFEEFYKSEVIPQLKKELQTTSVMRLPRLSKIVINSSISEAVQNSKALDGAALEIQAITGQKPVITKAKKSIASFKLREGQAIGVCVTLRRKRMYEFLSRLINLALPRVRDFKGVSAKSFDGRGNYTLGITEQIIFPEINYDKVDKIRGMNITICTSAKTNEEAYALLKAMGMPFKS